MKATGEVMAIAPSFEAGMMKAVRAIEISAWTAMNQGGSRKARLTRKCSRSWRTCDDDRLFCVFEALKRGISVDEIHDITKIDKWFISKLKQPRSAREVAG